MSDYDVGKLVASIEFDSTQMAKDIKTITSQLKALNSSFNTSSKDIDSSIGKVTQAVSKNTSSMKSGFTAISNSYRDTSKTITTLSTGIRTAMSTMSRTVDTSFKSLASTIRNSSASNANAIKTLSTTTSTAMLRMSSSVQSATSTMVKGFATIQAQSKITTDVLRQNEQTLLSLQKSYAALGSQMSAGMAKGFATVTATMQAQSQAVVSALKNIQLQAQSTQTSLNNMKAPNLDMSKVGYQGGGVNRIYGTLGTAPNQVYGNLGQTVGNVVSPLTKATNAMSNFGSMASKAFSVFAKLSFQAFILEQGVRQIANIFGTIVEPGMKFASSMETLRLGYAGIISSTLTQNGEDIPFVKALQISDALLVKMQDEALKTSLTMEELGSALQSTMALGIDAGMSLEQVLDLTVVGAQAVKTFGLSNQQVTQELRGLISGEAIRPGVDMLATVLGYTTKTVNKLREEGKLYEDVMKRMSGFQAASNEFQNTLSGLMSNLDDGIARVTGKAMEASGLFGVIKKELIGIQEIFFSINKSQETLDNGEKKDVFNVVVNEDTVELITKFYEIFAKLILVLEPVFVLLGKLTKVLLNGLADALLVVVDVLYAVTVACTPLVAGFGFVIDSVGAVIDALEFMVGSISMTNENLTSLILALGTFVVALSFCINPILGMIAVIGSLALAWKNYQDSMSTFGTYLRAKLNQFTSWFKAFHARASALMTLDLHPDLSGADAFQQESENWGRVADTAYYNFSQEFAKGFKIDSGDVKASIEEYKKLFENLKKKSYGDKDTTKGGKNKGNTASKEASNAYKVLDADLKKSKTMFKAQLKEIEDAFKNNQLSTQDYVEAYLKNKQGQIDKQISILKEKLEIAKRLGQENDIEKFSTELEKLEIDRAEALAEANRKLVDSYKKLQDTYDSVAKSYHGLYGATEDSNTLDIINDIGDSYTRVIVEIKTAQERLAQATAVNDEAQIAIWNNWVAKGKEAERQILAIARAKKQEFAITQAQAQVEEVSLRSIRRENEINHLVEQGRMDSLTAEGRAFYERQKYVDDYVKTYAKLIALYEVEAEQAAKNGSLEKQNEWTKKAEDARAAMKTIVEEVPPFQRELRQGFSDGLAGMFDDLVQGESWKDSLKKFGTNLLNEWASMWHKRMAQDITNKLFDAILPKGEKALEIDAVLNPQVEEFKTQIKTQMNAGVQAVTDGAINIKGQFDALIPTLQTFGQAVQAATAQASGQGSGVTSTFGAGVSGITGGFGGIGNSFTGANYGGMSLGNDAFDFDKYKENMNAITIGMKDFADNTELSNKLMSVGAKAQSTENDLTMQAGLQALPNMLMGLAAVSGNEGLMKFAMALQIVMQVIQLIQAMNKVNGMATGGLVRGAGTGTSDSIPTMLSNGEYVIKAASVKKLGVDYLNQLNNGEGIVPKKAKLPRFKFADGGLVTTNKQHQTTEQDTTQEAMQQQTPIQVVFSPTFQSLDPEANMRAFEQQYPLMRKKLIEDMRTQQTMRSAIRGAAR